MQSSSGDVSRSEISPMSQALHSPATPEKSEASAEEGSEREAVMNRFADWFFGLVPALGSLRGYSVVAFRADALAGLTVATVAVPQAMAYATIAGIPPQHGLYTAIIMAAVGGLFASSRQLINGPTNAL